VAEERFVLKEETRYRVTGSLFLLALAVIFLPMLFDGAGLPRVELPPVEPAPLADGAADGIDPEPPDAIDTALMERVDELAGEVDEAGFRTDTGTRLGEPVLGEPAAAVERPAPPAGASPGAEGSEPRLAEVSATTRAWAVQVASFADADNAKVFRGRLRDDGYEAFLSTLRTGDDVRTRVAVGPLQNRDEAVALQRELSTRYRVTARLMDFST
jgi:DedD protein